MGLFSRRRIKETIVASAEQAKLPKNSAPKRQGSNDKQRRAWSHYDLIPEMWFAHNYVANAMRRIRIFPAIQPDPSQPPIPLLPTDGAIGARANTELDRLRDVDGTHGTLIHDMALQLCVPGEGLFAWWDDIDTGLERYGIYSSDQLQRQQDEWVLVDLGQSAGQGKVIGKDIEAGGTVLVNRFWRPHPRYSNQPDSAFFPLSHTLDELLTLDQLYRSNGRSRVPSGILLAPQEIKMKESAGPGTPRGQGGPDQAKMDPLVRSILTAITEPLADEESAGNVAPPVIKAPADLIEKFRHMTFGREFDAETAARYDRLLQRAADGVDMPASLVMGASDLNHWSLWQVDEDAFDSHLAPLTQLECAAVTSVFLGPALSVGAAPTDEKVFVWYDASALISHPNKSKDALAANKQIIISDSATRRLLGYSEEDAPDDAERAEKIDREKSSGQQGAGGTTPSGPPGGARRSTLVADATPIEDLGIELAHLDHDLRVQVQAAIEGVVARVLEKAGNKMRARAGEAFAAQLEGVANRDVCVVLGAEVVHTFATDEELIDDAVAGVVPLFSRYVSRVQRVVRSTAQDYDAETDLDQLEMQQDADRQRGAELLTATLGTLITGLLYSPSIDAPSQGEVSDVLVPAGVVRDALATAGGSPSSTAMSPLSDTPQGGVATGETAMEIMIRVGLTPSSWTWLYGDADRKTPFAGHEDLNEVEFLDWRDDVLRVREEDAWLNREFYAPGDHLYCQCDFAPTMTKTDDATTDDTESDPVPVEA